MNNKNTEVLADFLNYCNQHPEQRFWQALRNWSGFQYLYKAEYHAPHYLDVTYTDTFYWEGKDK